MAHSRDHSSDNNVDMADTKLQARRVPMQVLSLGMPRTGTASMREALQILLGEPIYHALELFDHVDHCAQWTSAINAKFGDESNSAREALVRNIDKLLPLGDYAAITDVPAICFGEELVEAFPESKVVLVERDIETWYTSFDHTIMQGLWSPVNNFVAALDPWFLGPTAGVHHAWIKGWFKAGGLEEMRAGARGHYREYYAHVRKVTPPERLLEYKLGTGWEPLCEFLGRPVPDVPFPRVNESAAFDAKINELLRTAGRSIVYHASVYVLP
ncbi:P-loop containing nucleoside triphosphate hydrolase protein, partial [Microdochium bolleyi]